MAIEGPLRELGIHDVFQLLDLSRKTGRLRVTSALRDNEGTVYFKDGRVVSATVRSNPHPLGAILLRAGKLTDGDVERAREAQQAPGELRKLGEILVDHGVLSQRELDRQVRRQVEAVVFELMSWQEGFFSFAEVDLEGMSVDATTAVTTEALLMEGARRIDEWTHIRQRIAHIGVIPSLAAMESGHAPALELLPHEWEVLAAIDGEADLRAVAASLGRSEFEVAKIAFGLVSTGVIVVREPQVTPASEREPAELATLLNDAREALREQRSEAALSFAATAVSIAPSDPEARLLLARALFQLDRELEGEEELRRALELDGRNPSALMEAARLAARRGELGQAIAHWQRVALISAGTPIGEQARDAIAHASRLSAMLEAVDA
jgi:tetratricopeptide (TPR) repeat protein